MSRREHGFVLTVTLLILVVVLLLGVAAVSSSRLEESMAGNQRAASSAWMAAEYGGADTWNAVSNHGSFSDFGSEAFYSVVETVDPTWVGVNQVDSYYKVERGEPSGFSYPVKVYGAVYSGSPSGDGVKVSERILSFSASIGGVWDDLSPINHGRVASYDGMSSQAGAEGDIEDVDGYVNPAVSATSYEDAQEIVKDILGTNKYDDAGSMWTYVPDDPGDPDNGRGIFHAAPAVVGGEYTGDYSECDQAKNDLCNYKGGVATYQRSEILSEETRYEPVDSDGNPIATDPDYGVLLFHKFMQQVFSDAIEAGGGAYAGVDPVDSDGESGYSVDPSVVESFSQAGVLQELTIVTDGGFLSDLDEDGDSESYYPIKDSEGNEPLRYAVPKDSVSGSGILIVDGDVEFQGDPAFEGLIIVLGDYSISGSGGSDFKGAIVSAPYSCGSDIGCTFDEIVVDIRGGGSNQYLYDEAALQDAFLHLSPEAFELWAGPSGGAGGYQYRIASWKEVFDPDKI